LITVDVIKIEVSLVVSRGDVDSVGLSLGNAFGSSCQEDKAVDHVVGVQEFALNHFQHLFNYYYFNNFKPIYIFISIE
jgi:hypothetical protein